MPFLSAFNAVLCGDALGNLTPLGLIASEPTKAAFLRPHAPMGPAVAAVAIETLLYTLTVAAMIAATTLALLATVDLPAPMRHAAMLAVAAIAAGLAFAAWLSWRRPAIVRRVLSRLLPADSRLHATGDKLHDLERQIFTFASRRRDVLAPVLACQATFHALGVLEIYVTLWLILRSRRTADDGVHPRRSKSPRPGRLQARAAARRRRRGDDRNFHSNARLRPDARRDARDRSEGADGVLGSGGNGVTGATGNAAAPPKSPIESSIDIFNLQSTLPSSPPSPCAS